MQKEINTVQKLNGMIKKLRFYKDETGWWVDLPEYIEAEGDPADLGMVCGADDFLDKICNGENEIFLIFNTEEEVNTTKFFTYLQLCEDIPTWTGKYYKESSTGDIMWLCDVTKFVFNGEFPPVIWYKKL